ncbi:MAG: hypothetical protein ACO1SV_17390 [Fimbriimonas sp.]
MDPEKREAGVYGENVPTTEAGDKEGIREQTAGKGAGKGNEAAFDAVRDQAASDAETHGGMGRTETPRDGETQGEWQKEPADDPDQPKD